jgi:subtilisin family serine protease
MFQWMRSRERWGRHLSACVGIAWMTGMVAVPGAQAQPRGRHLDLPLYEPEQGRATLPAYHPHKFILELEPGTPRPGHDRAVRPNAARESVRSSGIGALDAMNAVYAPLVYVPMFPAAPTPALGSRDEDLSRFYVVELPASASLTQALEDYASIEGVAGAEPVPIVPLSYVPNDPAVTSQWQFGQANDKDSDVYEAWDVARGDTTIVIAIVDTGVLYDHEDLGGNAPYTGGNIATNWAEMGGIPGVDDDDNGYVDDVRGWDFVTGVGGVAGEDLDGVDNDPRDFAGHGTFCAGMASARTDNGIGIAGTGFKSRILPLRAGWKDAAGSSGAIDVGFAAQAINYAANNGANVINCSWESFFSVALNAAATDAIARGVTLCVAAGNHNAATPVENYLGTRGDCIDVGAISSSDLKASFSNYGPWVDVSAAGVGVTSTWSTMYSPGYLTSSGTSVASPFVAGAVGLYQGYRRGLGLSLATPSRIMLRVHDTGDDLDAANPAYAGMLGTRLNVYKLLTAPPTSWLDDGTAGFTTSPAIVDLDGDGDEEVVIGDTHGQLIAVTGVDGDTLPGFPVSLESPIHSSPAIWDVDLDGAPEIMVGTAGGLLYAIEADGSIVPGYPVFLGGDLVAGPAVADLDRTNPGLELAIGSSDGKLWVLDRAGVARPGWPRQARGAFQATPALHDFDGDGAAEIVVGALDSTLYGYRGDGTPMPGWPIALGDRVESSAAIGDIDRDGIADVVVGCDDHKIYGVKADGTAMAGWPVTLAGAVRASPALADLAGNDGFVEVASASDGAALYVLDHLGSTVPGWPQTLSGYVTGSVLVADVDGDGILNVVAGGTDGRLHVYSAAGVRKSGWPRVYESAISGSPSIADPDHDGRAEIIFGAEKRKLRAVDMGPSSWNAELAPWPTLHRDMYRRGSLSDPPSVGVPWEGGHSGAVRLTLQALPNPSRSTVSLVLRRSLAATPSHGDDAIRIYSVTGQLVRSLVIPAGAGNQTTLAWDGMNDRGQRTPSGIYLVRARWSGQEARQRLVRLTH